MDFIEKLKTEHQEVIDFHSNQEVLRLAAKQISFLGEDYEKFTWKWQKAFRLDYRINKSSYSVQGDVFIMAGLKDWSGEEYSLHEDDVPNSIRAFVNIMKKEGYDALVDHEAMSFKYWVSLYKKVEEATIYIKLGF